MDMTLAARILARRRSDLKLRQHNRVVYVVVQGSERYEFEDRARAIEMRGLLEEFDASKPVRVTCIEYLGDRKISQARI